MWKPPAERLRPSGEKATERSPASPIARTRAPDLASRRRTPPSPAVATNVPSGETATELSAAAGGTWRTSFGAGVVPVGSSPAGTRPRASARQWIAGRTGLLLILGTIGT